MEMMNSISCLHSALRALYVGEDYAVPGYLRMAKDHIDGAERYLEEADRLAKQHQKKVKN